MTHTADCSENAKQKYIEQNEKACAELERLEKLGVDTSGRGCGFTWECTCKTQEKK